MKPEYCYKCWRHWNRCMCFSWFFERVEDPDE